MKPIIKIVFTKLRGYGNLNTNLNLGNGVEFHNQYKSLKVIDCTGRKIVDQLYYIMVTSFTLISFLKYLNVNQGRMHILISYVVAKYTGL